MKKILFILAIAGLVFSSCGNKKKTNNTETHTHEDGTVHADDAHEHDAKPNQESFEVKADSDTEHKHADGDHDAEGHKHEHGDSDGEASSHDKDDPSADGLEHGDSEGHDNDHEHGEHK